MKICFIWVEKFRNLQNFGLNLSSDYKFKYDHIENIITKQNTKNVPENFFGNDITEVMGIIGKNGSGKSNSIELLCMLLKGTNSKIKNRYFIIIEDNGTLRCLFPFSNEEYPDVRFEALTENYNGNVNNLKVVYFSNVFDKRINNFDKKVSDISVNAEYKSRNNFRTKEVSSFFKQINFINTNFFEDLNIEHPNEVIVSIKSDFQKVKRIFKYDEISPLDKLNEFNKLINTRVKGLTLESKFINILRYQYFLTLILKFREYDGNIHLNFVNIIVEHYDNPSSIKTNEITKNLINRSLDVVREYHNSMPSVRFARSIDTPYDIIKGQLEQLLILEDNFIDVKIKSIKEGVGSRNLESYIFDYKESESKIFINELVNNFESINLLNCDWLGISSGHKAYLNLFSSIHNELKYLKSKNLLICIDEGDLYLHPKWQIEFFDKIINVLPNISSCNIQLILTSHSPFLLSDLPKNNITILDKNSENYSINGTDLEINTFGANLYDLYSEAFFLKNNRTGDFAYNKINSLINMLEGREETDIRNSDIQSIIDLIGDEVIQYKLNKLISND